MGGGAMTAIWASFGLASVFAWLIASFAGFVMPPLWAVGLGALLGLALAFGLPESLGVGGFMALLTPLGIMLPALALRHLGVKLGVPFTPFATWELALFFVLYTGFIASAFGVLPLELYRLGYAPLPVAIMVLAVCAYGLATGNWLIPLVAVLGQAAWVMGWGSSNWFDYVLHAMLWPVALIVLVGRMI
jgi:hypothetical protein